MTTSRTTPLPLPALFDPARAASYAYTPDAAKIAADAATWKSAHGLKPAATDEHRVHLLLIDVQKDFCFPEGSLYVAGRSGRGAANRDSMSSTLTTGLREPECCATQEAR